MFHWKRKIVGRSSRNTQLQDHIETELVWALTCRSPTGKRKWEEFEEKQKDYDEESGVEARPGSSQTRRRRRRLGTTGAQPAPALHPPAVRICRTCKATGGGAGGLGRHHGAAALRHWWWPTARGLPSSSASSQSRYTHPYSRRRLTTSVCVCGGKNHKLWLLWQQAVKP